MAKTTSSQPEGTAVPAAAEQAEEAPASIKLARIEAETLLVPIRGLSDLIVHRFSEKAKKQMLDAMQGVKNPKEAKDPEDECEAARYRIKGVDPGVGGTDDGMPSIAFKQATVGGARMFDKVTMTALRQTFFVRGDLGVDGLMLAPIYAAERYMRQDTVKVGRGGSDLRYRPAFREWSTTLSVTFIASMIDRDSVLALIDAGGLCVGVGDWRPERNGDFGTYEIDPTRSVESTR